MPSHRTDLEQEIRDLQHKLNILLERKALLGLEAPPTILVRIEHLQAELAGRQAELEAQEDQTWPTPVKPGRTTPPRPGDSPARLFICYRRHAPSDQQLAAFLYRFLAAQGHEVFFDLALQPGQVWLVEIDRRIKASDFVVVLLSKEAAHSEMVQAEIRRAYEYHKRRGRPHILPVRLAYEGLLPYAVDAFLDPLQYVLWESAADDERVGREILAAIAGHLPRQAPLLPRPAGEESIISEDGYPVPDEDSPQPPLPACDPRFLEELEAPGGTLKLRDKFYIEREADAHLKRQLSRSGTITTIRASRQKGKSSLLVRGAHQARQSGANVVSLDLQRVDADYLETPDRFLRYWADFIVRKLRLDPATLAKIWQGAAGPQEKLTYLLEDYLLPASPTPIVLALDEADSLLQTGFHDDFFGMLRSWHNTAAYDELWEKLSLVLVISTEPYLLIADVNQSPFNAGLKLYLDDFNEAQVRDLNWRHGSPVSEPDFPELMRLLNGHPYLTRKALYTLVTEPLTWAELAASAAADDGLFGDHLRRQLWLLRDEPDLRANLKQIIECSLCPDETALFRLLRAGLVQRHGDTCSCRCDLYRLYFEDKL